MTLTYSDIIGVLMYGHDTAADAAMCLFLEFMCDA